MSTLKSSAEDLTLNADGSGNDIIFQSNGSNVATLDQAGLLTATTFAGSGASLTSIPAANITGTLPAIDGSSLTGVSSFKQNIVKNGGFDVWQRGTSFTYTSGKNFIADRWWVTPNSGAHTQTRQAAGLDGFNYCLRMQRDASQTAVGTVYLVNEFESADSMQFRGKKLTFSFYARKGANFSQASSYLTSNLVTGTGTDQTLVTGFTGAANAISLNNTLTTSWQRFTHTTGSVIASSVNQIGIQFTTAHEGTAGAADYYEITGVQLEEGESATDFVHRPYGEELALCQRYYETYASTIKGATDASGSHYMTVFLKVSKRVAPTIAYDSIYSTVGNIDINGFTVSRSGGETHIAGMTADAEI